MKKIFLMVLVLGLVFGCATGPPVRNPQFTESSLPNQYHIEGIDPIKGGAISSGWGECVQMVLGFYGKPLDKNAKTKGMVLTIGTGVAFGIVPNMPDDYYTNALTMHGFKTYSFFDKTPHGTKIKYFLAQGHAVVLGRSVTTDTGPKAGLILFTGYDDSKEIFFVCDPVLGEAIEMPCKEFGESVPMLKYFADESKTARRGTVIYPKK